MKPIIIIPARGGSKGIPGKNIKLLGGKPLIEYTISEAKKITDTENIIVSTDSVDIKQVVENLGVKVEELRPPHLATDTATTQDVLLYEIEKLESRKERFDYIVLLQPTSPFRKSFHIREALDIYKNEYDMVVSVKETESNPYYVLKEENGKGFLTPSKKSTATRRQDVPKVWELNGAIYIINKLSLKKSRISDFKNVKKYEMSKYTSLDIDEPLDLLVAEALLKLDSPIL